MRIVFLVGVLAALTACGTTGQPAPSAPVAGPQRPVPATAPTQDPGPTSLLNGFDLRDLLAEARQSHWQETNRILGRARDLPNPDIESLRGVFESGRSMDIHLAVRLLGELEARGVAAVPFVLARFDRDLAARRALGDPPDESAGSEISDASRGSWEVFDWLKSGPVRDSIATQVWLRLATDEPRWLEAYGAAEVLVDRGVPTEEVLPSVMRFLDHPTPEIRQHALMRLSDMPAPAGPVGEWARRRLLALSLEDADAFSRTTAAGFVLGRWTVDVSIGIESLAAVLRSRRRHEEDVAEAAWITTDDLVACGLAGSLRGDMNAVLDLLMKASRSDEVSTRARAASALGCARFEEFRHIETVLGRIQELQEEDPVPLVRNAAEAATESIKRRGGEK